MQPRADQHPVEIIMARGLMSNLTTPAFLVGTDGTLVFFNDAAAAILGLRFEESGPMPAVEWGTRFTPTTPDGEPLAVDELPLTIALRDGTVAHGAIGIRGEDGVDRQIEITAFPVVGRGGQSGAIAIFWTTQA